MMANETSRCVKRKVARQAQVQRLAEMLVRFRRKEDGGLILFSLFILILMLIMGGIAVDVMRFETRRTALQNTLDAATLSATNINRDEIDPVAMVEDFMQKAGYDPDLVNVTYNEDRVGVSETDDGTLIGREVSASYDLDVNTFFMPLIGIDTLGTTNAGTAAQKVQNVEISLVVDISGSMGGQRIADLKSSASNFFTSVISENQDPNETEGVVSISVIPYNHTIVVDQELLDRLNTNQTGTVAEADRTRPNPAADPYDGAIANYAMYSEESKCVRFRDDEMTTTDLAADYAALRAITETQPLERLAFYDPDNRSSTHPDYNDSRPNYDWNRRCDPTRAAILPFSTSLDDLNTYITSLTTGGNTAIDNGLKWASALLDPAMRDVVNAMVDDGVLTESVRNRPGEYDPNNTLKVIVLMTDGQNTSQWDIETNYKTGPSRVWFSEQASQEQSDDGTEDWSALHIVDVDENGTADREKEWYDGYFIEYPENAEAERFLRPHVVNNYNDGVMYSTGELPADAVQLTYPELHERFAERDLARLHYDNTHGDYDLYYDIYYSEQTVVNSSLANERMLGESDDSLYGMCDAVKYKENADDDPEVLIFSIAFQAGTTAESVLRECATSDGYYYDAANGEELNEAFAAIAGAISKLRLTQ